MPQSTIAQWLKGSFKATRPPQENSASRPSALTATSDTFKITAPPEQSETTPRHSRALSKRYQHRIALKPLPNNVAISVCTADYIKAFRRLNALLLPIQYPDTFYQETLQDEIIASITRIALWTPSSSLSNGNSVIRTLPTDAEGGVKIVAGIRCRLLTSPPHKPTAAEPNLYISTIGTLAPFRELSLASHLMEEIFGIAVEQYGLSTVYAHVWEQNEEALDWYVRRGFTVLHKEMGYYQKLAPNTNAWLIKCDIG